MREILLVHFIVYACFCFIIILLLFIHAVDFFPPLSLCLSISFAPILMPLTGAAFCGHKLCLENYENGRKRCSKIAFTFCVKYLTLHFVCVCVPLCVCASVCASFLHILISCILLPDSVCAAGMEMWGRGTH